MGAGALSPVLGTPLEGKAPGRGRPGTAAEIRRSIARMVAANPLWRAPRLHGELQMLGIRISERTVWRILRRLRPPSGQTWKTFLHNYLGQMTSIDFFTVPTITLRVLFVLVMLEHQRRRSLHFNVTEHPTAIASLGTAEVLTAPRRPWQNPYAERLIGSIECLDHFIILNARHLKRTLASYFHYYHQSRTHWRLDKQCPIPRQATSVGRIIAIPHWAVIITATSAWPHSVFAPQRLGVEK